MNLQPEAASIFSLVEILGKARQLDANDAVFDFALVLLGGDAKMIEDIRRSLCCDPATLYGALTDDVNDVRKVLLRLWIELERQVHGRQTVDLTGFRLEKLIRRNAQQGNFRGAVRVGGSIGEGA